MRCAPRTSRRRGCPRLVGLGWSTAAAKSQKPASIGSASAQRAPSGRDHSGTGGAARQASTSRVMHRMERTEKPMRNPASPSRAASRPRRAVPAMPTCTPTHSSAASSSIPMAGSLDAR